MDGNPTNDIEINAEVTGAEVTGGEIATPEQRRLLRADQKQRLRDQVEYLLRAFESVPPPTDFTGVERMAKAAIAVNKALDTICPEDKSEDPQEEDEMNVRHHDAEADPRLALPDIAANSLSVAFGDFAKGYLIVDRAGLSVLRDPYSAKPYTLFYTTKRVGGGVQNFDAMKLLKMAAS